MLRALVSPPDPSSLVDFYYRAMVAGATTRTEVDAALGSTPMPADPSRAWLDWLYEAALARTLAEAKTILASIPERPSNYWNIADGVWGGGDDYVVARVRALAGDFAGA
jgi:hypothetical protein